MKQSTGNPLPAAATIRATVRLSVPALPLSTSLAIRAKGFGLSIGLCCALSNPAQAQAPRPDPADPRAEVPRVIHVSAFVNYQRLGEVTLTPWKESNATVGRLGGWRSYAQELGPTGAGDAPVAVPKDGAPSSGARSGHVGRH